MSDRYEHEQYAKGLLKPKDFNATAEVRAYKGRSGAKKSVNWRYTEAVTPIKNQGQCGAPPASTLSARGPPETETS